MIKNKPVKPHYDRKLHLDTMEDGKVDHHGMSAIDSQMALDWTQDPVYGESSQPPDYASTLQEAWRPNWFQCYVPNFIKMLSRKLSLTNLLSNKRAGHQPQHRYYIF